MDEEDGRGVFRAGLGDMEAHLAEVDSAMRYAVEFGQRWGPHVFAHEAILSPARISNGRRLAGGARGQTHAGS